MGELINESGEMNTPEGAQQAARENVLESVIKDMWIVGFSSAVSLFVLTSMLNQYETMGTWRYCLNWIIVFFLTCLSIHCRNNLKRMDVIVKDRCAQKYKKL